MNKIFEYLGSNIDLDKSRYDLALLYAKTKFEKAIKEDSIPNDIYPKGISELEFLSNEFYSAFGYYANITDEGIIALIKGD